MHGGEVAAGAVSGLIAPQAPEAERWETLWHYMQSGPGVFKGDLYFYGIDGDVRAELDRIDTASCPLYLLTGEYDYSCTPEDTLAVARAVPGAKVTIMKELGHFPMSENPICSSPISNRSSPRSPGGDDECHCERSRSNLVAGAFSAEIASSPRLLAMTR